MIVHESNKVDESDKGSIDESPRRSGEWLKKLLQKSMKFVQSDENKKYLQIFFVDPILNHILDRIFPYILVLSVLFTVLTCMVAATMFVVFMRQPINLREVV